MSKTELELLIEAYIRKHLEVVVEKESYCDGYVTVKLLLEGQCISSDSVKP